MYKKTKIIIFNKGGKKVRKYLYSFPYAQNIIEIVNVVNYQYLGTVFSSNDQFNQAISKSSGQRPKGLLCINEEYSQQSNNARIKILRYYDITDFKLCKWYLGTNTLSKPE